MIKHPLLSLDEWAVCLYDDSVLLAIVYDLSLLTERMKLTQARRLGISKWNGQPRS
jgi:hypothetical protein